MDIFFTTQQARHSRVHVAEPISASAPQITLRCFYACECVVTETMKGDKRRHNRYNKSDVFMAGITNVYANVRDGCMWSSARMGYVVNWYGRVVVLRSRTFDESSWCRSSRGDTVRFLMQVSWDWLGHWMQLDDRSGKLKSVELLNTAGWSLRAAEVGWVVECSWMVVAGSWDRSSRWMQLDGRCGQLRLVSRSLVNRCPGFDISLVWSSRGC